MNEEGEIIADEEKVRDIIENFWGDLLCLKENVTYGVKKELVDGGMKKEVWSINDQDLKRAIKLMKVNKATDESGMITEYIKVLGEHDFKNLSVLMNDVLSGESIPREWKESRVVLVHKGGSKKEVSNYGPIAIINVICKLFMMLIRDGINGWVEESGMLGVVQFFFRRGSRTDDNLFMLERMIKMAKVRKECLYVALLDIEKAYDRVNINKLFKVMRGYGVQEKLVDVIERIYDGMHVFD